MDGRRTSSFRHLLALVLVGGLGGFAVGVGCHHDDPCREGSCGCRGGGDCVLDCEVSPCDIECGELDRCDATCVDDCQVDCHDLDDCNLQCDEDCDIECDRLSNCDASCGARCHYACSDVSSCEVQVGPESEVECRSVGDCRVDCHGSCRVQCDNVGGCDVRCYDEQGESLGDAREDDRGDRVCD